MLFKTNNFLKGKKTQHTYNCNYTYNKQHITVKILVQKCEHDAPARIPTPKAISKKETQIQNAWKKNS